MDQAQLQSMIRETVGEAVAEAREEAKKFADSIEAQYGSFAQAKAKGQEVDFGIREGLAAKRDTQPATLKQAFAALAAGGNDLNRSIAIAKHRGQDELAAMLEANRERSENLQKILNSQEKSMLVSDFGDGGALVPEVMSDDVIGFLYAPDSALGLIPASNFMPMPGGNLSIPYLDNGVTVNYVGEVQAVNATQMETGQLKLEAKSAVAVVPVSNQLLRNPSVALENLLFGDFQRGFRSKMDSVFVNGAGTDGQPRGLRNWAVAANSDAQSGAAIANKVSDLLRAQQRVLDQNIDIMAGGYLTSNRTWRGLAETLDSNGNFLFMQELKAGMLMGYPHRKSSNIPTNLGGGANESVIVFADFSSVVVGDVHTLEVKQYPGGSFYNASGTHIAGISTQQTPIAAVARHDFACRYRGKEVALITGVTY